MATAVLNGPSQGYKAVQRALTDSSASGRAAASPRAEPMSNSSTSIQTTAESSMNLKSVRKVDGHVTELLSTVPQVAVYQYINEASNWERTLMEGTLFICKRSSIPRHGFVLLNRLSSDNLHQLVTHDLPIHVQNPFVLFKRNDVIYGLCFTEESTCKDVGQLLTTLGQLDSAAPARTSSVPASLSSLSSSALSHQKSLDSSLDQKRTTASTDRLTPSPSDLTVRHNGRDTSPNSRKEQARKVRSTSSRRSSEPVTTPAGKKTTAPPSSTGASSKMSSARRTQQRYSPQPSQTSGNSHTHRGVSGSIEKSRSAFSPIHGSTQATSSNTKPTSSPSLAKKLFAESENTDSTTHVEMPDTVPALKSLFAKAASFSYSSSQAPPPPATTSGAGKLVLTKAVSLAEIEKQMSMEAPSPTTKSNQVFSMSAGSVACDSDSHSSVSSPSSFSSSSSSADQHSSLIQPSMFLSSSASTLPSSLPTSNSTTAVSSNIHMTVQPPTPVGPLPSSSHDTRVPAATTITQMFPSIPPLVHSPGMRAAPLSSSKHPVARPSPITRQRQTVSGSSVEHTDLPNLSTNLSPVLSRRVLDSVDEETRSRNELNGHQAPQFVQAPPTATVATDLLVPTTTSSSSSSSSLMSPGMFQQQRSNTDPLPSAASANTNSTMVAGLTRSQLQQALLHLIQCDDNFIDTLHKAYIASLRVNRS